VNPNRQTGPHAHFITADPSNHFVLECDLGTDKVMIYRQNAEDSTLATNDPPFASVPPGSGARHLAFSHDGKLIAASDIGLDPKENSYVYVQAMVWNVKSGEKLFTIEGHKWDIDGLVFTRDDRFLLTGSVDTTIKFWDMKTGQEARTISLQPVGGQ